MEQNLSASYDELIAQAQTAYHDLHLAEAMECYLQAQELDPAGYEAALGLARTYSRMRREQEANAAAQKAVELGPQHAEGYVALGVLHFLADRYDEAIATLQKAIVLAPQDPEPHLTLAQVYTDQHKFNEARLELGLAREQIAAISDEHGRASIEALAWHSETYMLMAEGKETEAIACAQEVLALESANPYAACLAYSNLGILEARARHYDQAIQYLERAYTMNPFMYRLGGMLGRVLVTRNQYKRAAEVLQGVVEHTPPGNGNTRYVYAVALAKSRQRSEALVQYKQALREGLKGADYLVAHWQLVWLHPIGRYAVIAVGLAVVAIWFAFTRDVRALTFILLIAVILILQQTVGRRGR